MKNLLAAALTCLCLNNSFSQTPTFNTSNQSASAITDNWSFDFSSGASFGINSNENSLFRGNSLATKLSGRYAFGAFGLGLSGGLVPGSIDESAVNSFLTERKINPAQAQVTTGKPSNGYLLFGPSVRFGKRVILLAEVQGGMFMNDAGNMSVTQNGVQRPVYAFEGGGDKFAPGFSGTIQLAYPLNTSSRFFINTDYFNSSSTIRLIDQQAGIDVPTEQKRDTRLFTASIGFTKTFGATGSSNNRKHVANTRQTAGTMTPEEIASTTPQNTTAREAGTGLATGRRILPETGSSILTAREAGSGLATGRRYQPGQPVYGNISSREACGQVTQRTTYPDGTTEENTFACPADAAEYNRISMNVTVPKQTQGATFGEKVNQGLHAAGSALSQGGSLRRSEGVIHRDLAARNTISGRLSWTSSDNNPAYAIVTNTTQRGGSATLNSQSSSTRQTPQSSFGSLIRAGFMTNIYARDASSGRATGKRSREAGSGQASGRRQYQPVFFDNGPGACSSCEVAVVSNPLYSPSGNSGVNPMSENRSQSGNTVDENCDGVAGIDVYLLDVESRGIVAKTKTEACGDFWFAHVPEGNYIVKISGSVTAKKQYDITIDNKGSKDVAGEILGAPDSWALQLSVEPDSLFESGKIKTKSNIKNDRMASNTSGDYQYIKSLPVSTDDLNEDGRSESVVGGFIPGGAVVSAYARSGVYKSKSNVKNNRMVAEGDSDPVESNATVVGGLIPGGSILSSAFTAVGPIKGVIVKGGRNPGSDASRTSVTNEFGEFEFTDMEPGNYFIRTEHPILIDDETLLIIDNDTEAEQRVQDHNSSRSNKSSFVSNMGKDDEPKQKIQNNNTVRSNRGEFKSILIEADLDGDGDFETDISNSYAYLLATDEKGNYTDAQQKAGVSTSRSNIRNKSGLQDIGNDLYIVYGSANINGKTVETKSVLKTKHDTAKNSVGNIR